MSKGARKFVNPLTQPSTPTHTDTEPLPETKTPTLPETASSTNTTAETSTQPSTSSQSDTSTFTSTYEPRKRGKQAFEHTHKRITLWIDKKLEKRFDGLSRRNEVAKSTLLNEAIRDLLDKYQV